MAGWTEGVWSQDDSVQYGLPIVADAGAYVPIDFSNFEPYWDYTKELPVPKGTTFPPALDFNDVNLLFQTNNHNMGLPYFVSIKSMYDFGAFSGCSNLTSVKIPVSVTNIGYYTFNNTGLTSVTIPPDCLFYANTFPQGCSVSFYTASIDHIENNGLETDRVLFILDSDPNKFFISVLGSSYKFILRVADGGTVAYKPIKRFTISNVDTSALVEDQTGTITMKTADGSRTYTANFTYDVVNAPVSLGDMLGSGNENPEEPDEPQEENNE